MSNSSASHWPNDIDTANWTVVDFIDHPETLEQMTFQEISDEFDRRKFTVNDRGSVTLNWSQKNGLNGDPTSAIICTKDGHIVQLRMAHNNAYALNEIIPDATHISEHEAIVLFTHVRFGATHISNTTRAFLRQLYAEHGVHIRLKSTRRVLETLLNSEDVEEK